LTAAEKAGALSHDAANAARLKDRIALNDSQLDKGTITSGKQPYVGAIMEYAKQFTSLAKSIKDTFSGVFRTLSDGFADTIGRWITQGGNLKEMLKQVAREGIGELISGMIKLGIQQIITLTLGTAAATAATAAGVAQATTLTAAWTPAAFAASVATLGAADAIGSTAFATGLVTSQALAMIPKFDKGIDRVPYDMLAVIHKDEGVLPAADNLALRAAVEGNSGGHGAAHVEIHNYAGAAIDTEQMSDGRVRVIVKQMGKEIVAQHADEVVAGHIQNPNSKISKNISRNTDSRRAR
jgi:hypothetical protein